MLRRLVDWHLNNWKSEPNRKPLILRGARQVGKTHAVRNLGAGFDRFVEINFELTPSACPIFEGDLHPEQILNDLFTITGQKIKPGETLLFLDEIQEAPRAILALRYFYEKMPTLHVIAAGSLFDFALEKVGIPVGRVSSLYMYPLSFVEFLAAKGYAPIIESIMQNSALSKPSHEKLMALLGEYFSIGGMPEAVAKWITSQNPKESFQVHHNLISSYRQDFEKYATKHQVKYLEALFQQIPHMVGELFQYKNIHGEYRKRELAPALDLLCKTNTVHRIYHSAGNGLPLGGEVNLEWFKIILVDIAICQAILGFDLSTWFSQPGIESVNRGNVTEAFVGQELLCYSYPYGKAELYHWKRAERSSLAEVDFLYPYKGRVLPIEVKSGDGRTLKSMHAFLEGHKNSPAGIRFSAEPQSVWEKIDSRPLYAVASLAHEEQKKSILSLI